MRRPTIKDVAADCGVSKATVSLVLRDSPQIGEATKARVRASMVRLGYVYNRRAADMRSQQSRTLGLVVTNVRNPYFAELTMAIEEAAHEAGYTLLQGYSRDDVARQRALLETMAEHRIDGLMLLPASGTTVLDLDETTSAAGVPHVLIARSVRGHRADYVGADNVRSGRLIGEHLASLGVVSVAFLGGPRSASARRDRLQGLRQGLGTRGIVLPPDLSLTAETSQEGADLVAELLRRFGQPDAIVAYNDMYAFGVLNGLRGQGVRPGVDVAIASFDNVPSAASQQPPLTSVDGFARSVGVEATRLLLGRLAGAERAPRTVRVAPELLCRDSTQLWAPPGGTVLEKDA